ncbi:uncharacterized protein ARMOST_16260 [Armillaria ostoyae]|uniref:Uncharacterized protein n=1 Tax=Armillaria ostoyae TaxID=47428 RepID=A0A284RVP1_ARMOS|nr:uncharacterized protein ARMOST_16260 [Armillaria ostoyae]
MDSGCAVSVFFGQGPGSGLRRYSHDERLEMQQKYAASSCYEAYDPLPKDGTGDLDLALIMDSYESTVKGEGECSGDAKAIGKRISSAEEEDGRRKDKSM